MQPAALGKAEGDMHDAGRRAAMAGVAALAIALGGGAAGGGDAGADRDSALPPLSGLLAHGPVAVELVRFADPRRAPVRLLRGAGVAPAPTPAARSEIVDFGRDRSRRRVTVVRGVAAAPEIGRAAIAAALPNNVETIGFADPALPPVTIVRGPRVHEPAAVDLFAPADAGELDRIAFAVDGIESRHGADWRMWRPEFDGPQGPMQVSAAAAFDVGGGDRFDLRQNRRLGRAYLAQMFRRYGNWRDALAAYNWGPGNVDQWIAAGRSPDRLPLETARYVLRVLQDALILSAARP
jgi:hypothetical protein